MADFIAIVFVEWLFYVLIPFPGAVIRWLLSGAKRPFREVLKDPRSKNMTTGFLLFFAGILGYFILWQG